MTPEHEHIDDRTLLRLAAEIVGFDDLSGDVVQAETLAAIVRVAMRSYRLEFASRPERVASLAFDHQEAVMDFKSETLRGSPGPFLLAEDGPEAGRRYALNDEIVSIGRHPECRIRLRGEIRVSRQHAQIVLENDVFYVRDMASRNGTFLNEKRVGSELCRLRDGDRIRVCTIHYAFHCPSPRAAPNPDSQLPILVDDQAERDTAEGYSVKLDTAGLDSTAPSLTTLEARFAAMIKITRDLGRAVVLDDVLPQVLNTLFDLFPRADRGFIVMQDPTGELVPRWAKFRKRSPEPNARISRTVIRHVMHNKEAILSDDVAEDDRIEPAESIVESRIRSLMCAPLLDAFGNAIGAMQVDTTDQVKPFEPEDLEVLASVAVQAGIAVDNAQLRDLAVRHKSMERDLELANEVQLAFLPHTEPDVEGYDFFSHYTPAKQVGGDLYDYVRLPDGRMAVLVADVVGKGPAAALMMARVAAEAKYCLVSEDDPAIALAELNERISGMQVERFVTLVMTVIDPVLHEVTIVNAGHMSPIWRHAEGRVSEPGNDLGGLPIGIMRGLSYEQKTIHLKAGDMLAVYTDGFTEAKDTTCKQYTIPRLRKCLSSATGSVRDVGKKVVSDVLRHVASGPQTDDMCLVILHRR